MIVDGHTHIFPLGVPDPAGSRDEVTTATHDPQAMLAGALGANALDFLGRS